MKVFKQIIIVIFIISLIYVGYTYYKNYKKKETYKELLIQDLEQGYRIIKTVEYNDNERMVNEIQKYFSVAIDEYPKNEKHDKALEFLIRSLNINIYLNMETMSNINWKSVQQSGVLSQFSISELNYLNKAYTINEKLKDEKIKMKNIVFEHFSYNTRSDIFAIKYKFFVKGITLSKQLFDLQDAAKNAIKELNPDNKLIKELNSLKNEK